jgi:branched-subunit amino acid aminotransferase/4-amino-4-deoxychorismate lyase
MDALFGIGIRIMNQPQAFLNGQWIPASEASVPLGDAGFVLGATIAEQLRTFGGKIFRLEDHLARMEQSLKILDIDPGMTRQQFVEVAHELVAKNHRLLAPGDDLGLSIFVTPGLFPSYAPKGVSHPMVCLHTYALPFYLWAQKYATGQALATTNIEQVSSRSWPASLKCRSRIHYYLADKQAVAIDPQARALLLDAQGFVAEASTANVVVYRASEGLISPPLTKVLHGISLSEMIELAQRMGIPFKYRDLTVDDVATADEVMLSSTPLCLLPVTRFNNRPIGSGAPGPIFARIMDAWSEAVGIDIVQQAVRFTVRA